MSLRLLAMYDLLKRYAGITRLAWRHRHNLKSPERLAHEAEFLPAALALQETPVSPAPRVAMWLLIIFATLALLWAFFGRLDVVAVAQGKIVPNDRVKVIQPMETATVKAILVADGQRVEKGDLLIELDATSTGADTARLKSDLTDARLQAARAEALLTAMDGEETTPVLPEVPDANSERTAEARRLLEGQWREYRAKIERIDTDIKRRTAELRSTRETVNKLFLTLPIARHREEVFRNLMHREIVSKQDYLERKLQLIEQEGQRAAMLEKLTETQAAVQEAEKQKAELTAETRRTVLDTLREAEQKISTAEQELVKAQQRDRLMRLTAPVDGTVQQLVVHTIGGVVTPAQELMIIVPQDNALEVEAFAENKDIGFIEPDQTAEVKIETFPYTKYGTIDGTVTHVSSDAIQDDKRGLIYSVRVKLARSYVQVGTKIVNLAPGMAVTAEIKTGKRRVIEYLLTPLMQHTSESLRER
jgi:hemolysin D